MFEPTRRPTFDELIDLGNHDLDRGWLPIRHTTRADRIAENVLGVVMTVLSVAWIIGIVALLVDLFAYPLENLRWPW